MAQPFDSPHVWDRRILWTGLVLAVLVPLFSAPLPFFWDAILLGSQTALHFYEQGFDAGQGLFILPDSLDAGHPPLFGAYLALWWKLLGPTLPVAHLAMIPVLLGLWWNFYRLIRRALPGPARWIATGLLLLEPTFVAQAIHVMPDLVLLTAYLWGLNAILDRKPFALTLALLLGCAISLRGCFHAVALFGTLLYFRHQRGARSARELLSPAWLAAFVGAALAVLFWLWYHAQHTGWWTSNPDGPWAANAGFAGGEGMLRNLGLVAWRVLDFGRLVLWVPGFIWVVTALQKGILKPFAPSTASAAPHAFSDRDWLAVFGIPLVVLSLCFMPFRNPVAHRYLLPVLVLALPWFAFRISRLDGDRQKLVALALVATMGFGHRWIYPDTTAQGWDASLAHLPYFSLMQQAQDQIPEPDRVYTGFPLFKPLEATRPGSKRQATPFRQVEGAWTDHDYVLYSNITNDIPDAEYHTITESWPLLREWSAGKVFIRLYRRPGVRPMELGEAPEDLPVGNTYTP